MHSANTSGLANLVGFLKFLDSCDLLVENTDSDDNDDDIISHTRECYFSTTDGFGENEYHTPEHSPCNHFDFNYAVPNESSQEAQDC